MNNDNKSVKTAVLAIDIGGGGMKWGLVGVNEKGELGEALTVKGAAHQSTPIPEWKAGGFVAAYQKVLNMATRAAEEHGAVLTGVGIGSPGRFIDKSDYRTHYPDHKHRLSQLEQMELGDPYGKQLVPMHGVDVRVVAPGSNPNIAVQKMLVDGHEISYSELDGVALPALLQSSTPVGIKLRIENDAVVQMQAIANGLDGALSGKKAIYIGFGTGVGAGVMDEKGEVVTDGHFQHTIVAKREDDPVAAELYENIRAYFLKNGELSPDKDVPTGEMMFSATKTINRILLEAFDKSANLEGHERTVALKECEKRMKHPAGDVAAQEAVAKLKAIGRYMADFLENLRKGEFAHRDPAAGWSADDKEKISGFGNIVFGGRLAVTPPFQDFILPAIEEELQKKNLSLAATGERDEAALHYVCADNGTIAQTLKASASLLDKETLMRTPEEIAIANKRSLAQTMRR